MVTVNGLSPFVEHYGGVRQNIKWCLITHHRVKDASVLHEILDLSSLPYNIVSISIDTMEEVGAAKEAEFSETLRNMNEHVWRRDAQHGL